MKLTKAEIREIRVGADAMELLTWIGTTPVCSVALADDLGFDGQRFLDAVHSLRESGIRLVTCDRETICVASTSWAEALSRADAYANRYLLN